MKRTFTCFIVEDENHAIDVLTKYVKNTPGLELIGAENNPLAALHAIESKLIAPDITFVDVDMPYLNGIELGKLIDHYTHIIFYSAFPKHAVESYEINAIDFLLKPVAYERFLKSIEKAHEQLIGQQQDDSFFINDFSGKAKTILRVNVSKILFIKAYGNHIQIHTFSSTIHTIYLSLKEAEENLPPKYFCRISKSFIVNLSKIEAVIGKKVIMENKIVLSISPSYRKHFLDQIKRRTL